MKKLSNKIKKNKIPIFAGLIFIIFLVFFVVKPGIIGYVTYQDMKEHNASISEYTGTMNELIEDRNNLENKTLINLNEITSLNDELDEKNIIIVSSELEVNKLEDYIDSLDEKIDKLKEDIKDLNNDIDNIQEDYDTLAENSGDNICCKMKVDNANIKYREIINNKIVCLESGKIKINCNI